VEEREAIFRMFAGLLCGERFYSERARFQLEGTGQWVKGKSADTLVRSGRGW